MLDRAHRQLLCVRLHRTYRIHTAAPAVHDIDAWPHYAFNCIHVRRYAVRACRRWLPGTSLDALAKLVSSTACRQGAVCELSTELR